jgi:2-dehydropantoate 2-reductase
MLLLRIIFGVCNADDYRPELKQIEQDLNDSEILGVLSDNIKRDALLKFSYVSAQSTCGMYYDVPTGPIQEPGEIRDCFAALISEINTLANAMGIFFEEDIVARNLKILDDITPDMTTSMQRDIYAGRASEIDGQIYEVVRMADKYGVELPTYRKIAAELKKKY